MKETDNNYVKILFRFYSKVLEEETVETMWATIVDKKKGLYKLDNIPFYAPLIASDDIVHAEYDEKEQFLTYRKTVEYSGNSTVQVALTDQTKDISKIRDIFKDLGCTSEGVSKSYFAMEIPYSIDYKIIKQKLVELSSSGIIDYAESCLSEDHRI